MSSVINPNDSQLPNQLEGQSVKGQVKAVGMTEMARCCVNVFEVGMTPEEFCDCYRDGLTAGGITEGHEREMVAQARTAYCWRDMDVLLGQHKVGMFHFSYYSLGPFSQVFLTQRVFYKFEDQLRIVDADEQKRNHVCDSEARLEPRGNSDPYAPYLSVSPEGAGPWNEGYGDNNLSSAALPLVSSDRKSG